MENVDKKNETINPEIENVEATELEDDVLDDVAGGTTTNNCNCSLT